MNFRRLSWLAIAGACLGVLAVVSRPLPPADTWWHLAAGDYLWATRSFPSTDPFSFTSGDHLWTNHEWLMELFYSALYSAGGLTALYVFRAVAVLVAFVAIPVVALYRAGKPVVWMALAPLIVWCGELDFYADIRAYLVTYVLLSFTVLAMLEYRRSEKRVWLVLCAAVQVVWVNSHGAFILGPAVMGVFGLIGPRRKSLLTATGVTLAMASLNPYGPSMLLFPFSLLQKDAFSVGLNEWAAPKWFSAQLPYTALLGFVLLLAWHKRKSLDYPLFFSTLPFLLLGLKSWRHEPLAALLLCFFIPLSLSVSPNRKATVLVALTSFFASAILFIPKLAMTTYDLSAQGIFPIQAVSALESNPTLPPNIWTPYGWGGYTLWKLGPEKKVFWDGRAHTVYPESVYRDGNYIQYGDSWLEILRSQGLSIPEGSRLELLSNYGTDLVVCSKDTSLSRLLTEARQDWFELYQDFDNQIFLRNTPANQSHRENFRRPRDGWVITQEAYAQRGTPSEVQLLREAIALEPYDPRYKLMLASALLNQNQKTEAIAILEQLLKANPNLTAAQQLLKTVNPD